MDFIKELNEVMSDIKYGWADSRGYTYPDLSGDFMKGYRLQSPQELQKTKYGVCWDQVELERFFLNKQGVKTHAYNIIHYSNDVNPKMRTHTFVLFKYDGKIYWYEHAWEKRAGIYSFSNTYEALNKIRTIFLKDELNNLYDKDYVVIYEYQTPNPHLTPSEFYAHCESSRKITL